MDKPLVILNCPENSPDLHTDSQRRRNSEQKAAHARRRRKNMMIDGDQSNEPFLPHWLLTHLCDSVCADLCADAGDY